MVARITAEQIYTDLRATVITMPWLAESNIQKVVELDLRKLDNRTRKTIPGLGYRYL